MIYFNSTQRNMSLEDVMENIRRFIAKNPDCRFNLAVGTDSQVKGSHTCFALGIHIHRVGQGAWCCISKTVENRRYSNIREKISKETSMTYEIVNRLYEGLMEDLCNYSIRYKNFDCRLEAHIDVGQNGASRKLIREMVGYFEGMGITTKIKPDSFVASCYANKYSKNIKIV